MRDTAVGARAQTSSLSSRESLRSSHCGMPLMRLNSETTHLTSLSEHGELGLLLYQRHHTTERSTG